MSTEWKSVASFVSQQRKT